MNISKNVIRDLLPVYVAGEASAETRALVDDALAGDQELRAEIQELGTVPMLPQPAAPQDLGVAALKRTQRLLRERTVLVGFCYFFTALTFAFVARPGGILYKLAATACFAIAIGGWAGFLRNAVRLRDTGLQPRHSRRPQILWQLGAWCIVTAGALVLQDWTHWRIMGRFGGGLIILVMPLAYLGQRLKQYEEAAAAPVVETLFTLEHRHDPEEPE